MLPKAHDQQAAAVQDPHFEQTRGTKGLIVEFISVHGEAACQQ